jgi:hypothetical protein
MRRAATSLLIGTGVGAAVGVLFAPGPAVLTGWVAVAGIALSWV